jgi:hypothetical protein
MTGPALVGIPVVIQHGGWLPVAVLVVLMIIISSVSAMCLSEAMSYYDWPNNAKFQQRVELTTLVQYYFGSAAYRTSLVVLNVGLLSLNIASVIASAQAIDLIIHAISGKACGLRLHPDPGFVCLQDTVASGSGAGLSTPFPSDVMIVSVGIVVVLAVVIPLGYVNITDNIIVQQVAFIAVVSMVLLWIVDFSRIGFHGSAPVFNTDQQHTLGQILFNFVIAVTVPSWLNEKRANVNVTLSIVASTTAAGAIFFFAGLFASLTFVYPSSSSDLLGSLVECSDCFVLTRGSGYVLPITTFLSSIPVYAIIVQNNLVENQVCNKPVAFVTAVIVPWLIAVPFYNGSGLVTVINYASLFLQSLINFFIPLALYLEARRVRFAIQHAASQSAPSTVVADTPQHGHGAATLLLSPAADSEPLLLSPQHKKQPMASQSVGRHPAYSSLSPIAVNPAAFGQANSNSDDEIIDSDFDASSMSVFSASGIRLAQRAIDYIGTFRALPESVGPEIVAYIFIGIMAIGVVLATVLLVDKDLIR